MPAQSEDVLLLLAKIVPAVDVKTAASKLELTIFSFQSMLIADKELFTNCYLLNLQYGTQQTATFKKCKILLVDLCMINMQAGFDRSQMQHHQF